MNLINRLRSPSLKERKVEQLDVKSAPVRLPHLTGVQQEMTLRLNRLIRLKDGTLTREQSAQLQLLVAYNAHQVRYLDIRGLKGDWIEGMKDTFDQALVIE